MNSPRTGGWFPALQRSAVQQAIEVLTLPLFRLLVIQEPALLAAKFRRVHIPTPIHMLTWDELV